MKKGVKFLTVMCVAFALTLALGAESFAATFTCSKMEPTLVNTNSVWMKNVSGAACGTLASGSSRYFLLNESERDQQLAILLTAMSLDNTVWVNSLEDIASGAVVNVLAITK